MSCIDRYNGFIYRRDSESRGGAGSGIGRKVEERSKEHEVESGNTKGWTTGMNRRRAKDKDIQGRKIRDRKRIGIRNKGYRRYRKWIGGEDRNGT